MRAKLKIAIIDYQLGNISSIINMLKKIGVDANPTSQISDIADADKLILPGIGAFDHGMLNLHSSGLINTLNHEVLIKKKPFLGICLGMQLLLNASEEGKLAGLGWLPGKSVRFQFHNDQHLKIPHMGWNVVKPITQNKWIEDKQGEENRFYFVHSYHAVCEYPSHVICTTHHGYEFPSIIGRDHILGVQFHPEKSHRFGMQFLKNFIECDITC